VGEDAPGCAGESQRLAAPTGVPFGEGHDVLIGWGGAGRQGEAPLKYFKEGQWPASTYLVVAALAVPQMLVEVEAVAMIGSGPGTLHLAVPHPIL
jgi:hypothetical protein